MSRSSFPGVCHLFYQHYHLQSYHDDYLLYQTYDQPGSKQNDKWRYGDCDQSLFQTDSRGSWMWLFRSCTAQLCCYWIKLHWSRPGESTTYTTPSLSSQHGADRADRSEYKIVIFGLIWGETVKILDSKWVLTVSLPVFSYSHTEFFNVKHSQATATSGK